VYELVTGPELSSSASNILYRVSTLIYVHDCSADLFPLCEGTIEEQSRTICSLSRSAHLICPPMREVRAPSFSSPVRQSQTESRRQGNVVSLERRFMQWRGTAQSRPVHHSEGPSRFIAFHRVSRHVEPFVPRSRNEAPLTTTSFFMYFFAKKSQRESTVSLISLL
jgi:hypothetical protein